MLMLLRAGRRRGGASPLLTNLVSYWKLDEASGTRMDAHGANHLTDNNTVAQAAGKLGSAALFVAANLEYLSVASNASVQTGDIDYAYWGWEKPTAIGANEFLLSRDNECRLVRLATGVLRWQVFNISAATMNIDSTETVTTGVWYWWYVDHNSVTNQIRISVNNGTLAAFATTGAAAVQSVPLELGRSGGASYLSGTLDAVGFSKRVLTADERTSLYNAGAGREYPF